MKVVYLPTYNTENLPGKAIANDSQLNGDVFSIETVFEQVPIF